VRTIINSTTLVPATATPPAGPYDLVTLELVKEAMRIADANTTDDTWIQNSITRGSIAMQSYCGRVFQTETVQDTIYLQCDDYPYQVPGQVAPLSLSRYPIQSVTSVVVQEGINILQTLNQGTDFIVDNDTGQMIRLNPFTGFPTNWDTAPTTTIFVSGYATVPYDLQEAVIRWVAGNYQARARDPLLKEIDSPQIGRKVYWIPNAPSTHFAPEIAELLDKYRVPTVM
jgi:hypothetical protein